MRPPDDDDTPAGAPATTPSATTPSAAVPARRRRVLVTAGLTASAAVMAMALTAGTPAPDDDRPDEVRTAPSAV